jgi:hypothetical protein
MQKISTYLYPNRIELLADLAGFTTEYTNVYQRTVKIYNGIDNVIEFDIKNADQKRIETRNGQSPAITQIELNIMDVAGTALPNSPYTVTPTSIKGIVTVTIPEEDLVDLEPQFLKYSVTALKDNNDVMLYGDSRFGAVGRIELVGDAMPTFRDDRVYNTFTAEIDLKGQPTYHSSAIPAKFYEAVPTDELSFEISLKGFTGSVWVEGTTKSTINTEAFKNAPYLDSYTFDNFTGAWNSTQLVEDYQYFRISYTTPVANGVGSSFIVDVENGVYNVQLRAGGTGYGISSQMKVLGSALGGTDGINDLIITVTGVDGYSGYNVSSYAQGAINVFTTSGSGSGNGTYIVTGKNITGTVDKVTVS